MALLCQTVNLGSQFSRSITNSPLKSHGQFTLAKVTYRKYSCGMRMIRGIIDKYMWLKWKEHKISSSWVLDISSG